MLNFYHSASVGTKKGTNPTSYSRLTVNLVLVALLELFQEELTDLAIVTVVTKAVIVDLAFRRASTTLLLLGHGTGSVLGSLRRLLRLLLASRAREAVGYGTNCTVGNGTLF